LASAVHREDIAIPLRSLHADVLAELEAELEFLVAEDLIPTWVRPAAMAQLIVALVNGVALGLSVNPQTTNALDIGQQFVALLTHPQPRE
jgi:hypothetical protein